MDKNGNSDVIGALIEINKKRTKVKYGSSDVNTIVQTKAEEPITPQEAIMVIMVLLNGVTQMTSLLESFLTKLKEGHHLVVQ